MRLRHIPIGIACSVLSLHLAHAGIPTDAAWPRVTLPEAERLPVLDGVLGEQEWASAVRLGGFVVQRSLKPAKHQPAVYMAWHDAGLLVALDAPLQPGKRARASYTAWNGVEWQDDLFSVRLDPGHTHAKSRWFAINALGTKSDGASDGTTEISWQAAATNAPGRWCAEMLIPWAALGTAKPAAGSLAGFSLAVHAGWLGGILSWAPPAHGGKRVSQYAHLAFGSGAAAVSLSGLEVSRSGDCLARMEASVKTEAVWTLSRVFADGKTEELERAAHVLEPGKPVAVNLSVPREQGFAKGGDYLLRCVAPGRGTPLLSQTWNLNVGPPVELAVRAFITRDLLRVEARPDTALFPAAETEVRVSLEGPAGRILEQAVAMDPKSGEARIEIPGTRIPKGRLTVQARAVRSGTNTVFTVEKTLESPLHPPWLGTQEGITREVPAPWTPVEAEGDAVRCWGRSYRFTRSVLPTEVETRGAQILAGPIMLTGRASGAPLLWREGKVAFSERGGARAVLAGNARAAGVTLSGNTTVEFDGMIRVDLKLTPDAGAALLEDLTLEIPLKAEHARYLYHFPGMWGSIANSAALPAEGWTHGFKPFVWLGDEDRGFAWFCESDRNWFPLGKETAVKGMFDRSLVSTNRNQAVSGPDAALTIRREGGTVMLRCRLIQGEQRITGPLEYTFGFHATPVKNPEKTVWDYRITHHGRYGLEKGAGGCVTYAADGRINPEQGTAECWYRPGFDSTEHDLPEADRKNIVNRPIFTVKWDGNLSSGSNCGFYWNQRVRGMVAWARKEGKVTLNPSAPFDCKAGQWYHLALTWSDRVRLYVDGKLLADSPNTGFIPLSPEKAVIEIGGADPMATIDELRILRVARAPVAAQGEYAPDADTLLLDHFEDYGKPGATPLGKAEVGVAFVPAKFGAGPTWDPAQRAATRLQRLADLGVRTVCFHEHWSPYQSYPYVTDENRPKLHSLVDGAHRAGVNLLLYMSRQFADNAPEWELYSEDVLPMPRSGTGAHTRQPPQKAYFICWNSPWKDFCLYHLGKMMDEFGHDGWYLDGSEWPIPCSNPSHGCGYTAPDGTVRASYDIFATRDFVRRLYVLTRQRKPEGQLNIHNSTVMVTPTLAWATSTWGGEQLDTHKPGVKTLDILPMDSFQTELMGRQWGIPSELLVYEGMPYYGRDMLAYSLLHGVLVRPGDHLLPQVSALWSMYDRFPFKDAAMYPYWNNADRITCAPAGVYATAYERKQEGLLLFVSNLGEEDVAATVTLNLKPFGWDTVTAWDALTEKPLDANGGVLRLPLAKWRFAAVRIKPATCCPRPMLPAMAAGRNPEHATVPIPCR